MFPIAWMCRKLGVERSSYYAWKNRQGKPNSYVLRRKSLAGVVREIFTEQNAGPVPGGSQPNWQNEDMLPRLGLLGGSCGKTF